MFESKEEEISERMYNSDEDDYVYKPKVNNKDIIKTKPKGVPSPKTTSTLKLCLHIKNVMINLGIK